MDERALEILGQIKAQLHKIESAASEHFAELDARLTAVENRLTIIESTTANTSPRRPDMEMFLEVGLD